MPEVRILTWANVQPGQVVRYAGDRWATVLAVQAHIHDRAETGVDLWDSTQERGRRKVSLEVRPQDPVTVRG